MTAYSLLDLVPIVQGGNAAQALANAADLAAHVEGLGYTRYWVAEHHGMDGIASAATAVVIAHVGQATSAIRIGAGGIMLPNHAPLQVAEQFGTLDALFPGRVDLGLGRAPGSDQRVSAAIRRGLDSDGNEFPREVAELQSYFADDGRTGIRATPGAGAKVDIWILGSSLFGAQLAAMLGLPYAFASHFAPDALMQALEVYRAKFAASEQLDKPYTMAGINVIAAETDAEARRLFTSSQQQRANMFRGTRGQLAPPIDDIETYWTPSEKIQAERTLTYSFVGSAETVRRGLAHFIANTGVDELMVVAAIYDHKARLRSYEILAEVAQGLKDQKAVA